MLYFRLEMDQRLFYNSLLSCKCLQGVLMLRLSLLHRRRLLVSNRHQQLFPILECLGLILV